MSDGCVCPKERHRTPLQCPLQAFVLAATAASRSSDSSSGNDGGVSHHARRPAPGSASSPYTERPHEVSVAGLGHGSVLRGRPVGVRHEGHGSREAHGGVERAHDALLEEHGEGT